MVKDLKTKFTLGVCLLVSVKLTKVLILININMVVMVLDLMPVHNFCTKGEWGKNIVIFGAGNCLPQCADNRNSYFSSC